MTFLNLAWLCGWTGSDIFGVLLDDASQAKPTRTDSMDRGEKWKVDNMTALTELLVSRAPLRSKEAVLGLARYCKEASSYGQDHPRLSPRQIAPNLAKFEEKVFQFVKLFPISRSLRLAEFWFWTTRYDWPNNGSPYSLEHGHEILAPPV
jgi:hypothetical protein